MPPLIRTAPELIPPMPVTCTFPPPLTKTSSPYRGRVTDGGDGLPDVESTGAASTSTSGRPSCPIAGVSERSAIAPDAIAVPSAVTLPLSTFVAKNVTLRPEPELLGGAGGSSAYCGTACFPWRVLAQRRRIVLSLLALS